MHVRSNVSDRGVTEMLGLLATLLVVWLVTALVTGETGLPDGSGEGPSRIFWLVIGSLFFSLIMAKLGFPFFFLILPPIIFVSKSGSKED